MTARVTVSPTGGRDVVTGRGFPPGTKVLPGPRGVGWIVAGVREHKRAWAQWSEMRARGGLSTNQPGDPCAACGVGHGTVHAWDAEGRGGWVCETRPDRLTPCAQHDANTLHFAPLGNLQG